LTCLLWLGWGALAFAGDEPGERIDQLKAGYLYNFVRFVEWPTSASPDAITICFRTGSGLREALAAASAGKRIGARQLVTRDLSDSQPGKGCDVLFVSSSLTSAQAAAALPEPSAPVLTVSDSRGFARRGGMIELYTEGNRMRFDINLTNARRAGLKISSNLLQLATVLEEGPT
jgi:hypothetical protein